MGVDASKHAVHAISLLPRCAGTTPFRPAMRAGAVHSIRPSAQCRSFRISLTVSWSLLRPAPPHIVRQPRL